MSFSSRRRNYLLTPHRRDGLIEWMKSMLQHSFVLDALETTGADTFSHFEMLIDEHRIMEEKNSDLPSRLKQIVPTVGVFHTPLPLRAAFTLYNEKHRLTKRKHIQISFNEIRHILNLAQIMALRKGGFQSSDGGGDNVLGSLPQELLLSSRAHENNNDDDDSGGHLDALDEPTGEMKQLDGPQLISFDGDQTLYSDGANFEDNPRLARYMELLLRHGCCVAVVTAAGYEYKVEKYEYRLSGLLKYFEQRGLTAEECERFYLFGGECNYLLQLGGDYRLHPVKERGPGGWMTSTQYLQEAPGNWAENKVQNMLDVVEKSTNEIVTELNLRGRVIRKRRSVGLVPKPGQEIPRESLDETVLRVQAQLRAMNGGAGPGLPFCAFNGGTDAWVDVGNKRVGVQVLQSYLGIEPKETLHIGDQFLNTGNDYAARAVSPCIWIINPQETTYILKSILRLAGVNFQLPQQTSPDATERADVDESAGQSAGVNFEELSRRRSVSKQMDVYTGELINKS